MISSLDILPLDIKRHVLLPLLDEGSKFSLRMAYGFPLTREDMKEKVQIAIVHHGPDLMNRFWHLLNKDLLPQHVIIHGDATSFRYIRSKGVKLPHNICDVVAAAGDLPLLKFLQKKGGKVNEKTCCEAAIHGHLHILSHLLANGRFINNMEIWFTVARHGHLNLFHYLEKKYGSIPISYLNVLFTETFKSGNMEMVQYLKDKGASIEKDSLKKAARSGHLSVLHYLLQYGEEYDTDHILIYAARSGNIDMVKDFIEKGFPLSSSVYYHAILSDNPQILSYLDEINCPRSDLKSLCDIALQEEKFSSFQYLLRELELDEDIWYITLFVPPSEKLYDIFHLLHSLHYPFPKLLWEEATRKGRLDILQFAFYRGVSLPIKALELIGE